MVWIFFFKNHHKTQPNKWDFFFCCLCQQQITKQILKAKDSAGFPSRKVALLCFFSPPFGAGPGTRKERLLKVKAVVLISCVYVLLMWEEAALLHVCLVNLPQRGSPLGLQCLETLLCGGRDLSGYCCVQMYAVVEARSQKATRLQDSCCAGAALAHE